MMLWLLAIALGCALAFVSYGRATRSLFALRALAGTCAAALLFNAPLGFSRPLAPWVALDASASWGASGSAEQWGAAVALADSAMRAGGDSLLLFGSAARGGIAPDAPSDSSSRIGPLVEQARALGRPLTIITDGRLDDAERLDDLPRGSVVIVPDGAPVEDLGIAALDAPRAAVMGDTVEIRVMLRAGGAGAAARSFALTLGGSVLGSSEVAALGAFEEQEVRVRVAAPSLEGEQRLVAALAPGDAVVGNDSAQATLRIAGMASVSLVSTSPDQDARLALAVLRATQRGAVRAYWRVAPGQWREGDALRPVAESVVRRAVEQSSLTFLHGDTAYFGPPRARAQGALVLLAPPEGSDEYYVTSAGDSPVRGALAELPWDALPPLRVGSSPRGAGGVAGARGAGTSANPRSAGDAALLARRARRGEERTVVTLQDGETRVAVVSASGLWRWRARGGRSADAFDAVWGSIFDWVGAGARDGPNVSEPPRVDRELVPRSPTVASGPVGTSPVRDLAPRARGAWWLAAIALLALCGEWVMRRRFGWR